MSIDITPLVDVIFLLLIFFMVSTTFVTTSGINVNLPKASVKVMTDKKDSLELVITEKNKHFVNGKPILKTKLKSVLAASKKKSGYEKLIIRADGDVKHKDVVYAMDMAKQVGLHKLSIATKRNSEK